MSTIDLAPPRPGVVDQHVDAAEMLNSASDERLHVIFLGDVTDYRVHFTELGRLLLESPFVSVADDDAPSSRLRFATAEPIPVPAAAVTTTTLSRNRSRPAG
jgi:hypothetical protein